MGKDIFKNRVCIYETEKKMEIRINGAKVNHVQEYTIEKSNSYSTVTVTFLVKQGNLEITREETNKDNVLQV